MSVPVDPDALREVVRDKYAAMARSGLSSRREDVRDVAAAFGYAPEDLDAAPQDANLALSCGNPTALANLRPGETVLDLGSGGGLDVFLAARKVGPQGMVHGVDMTPEMIELANRNLRNARDERGEPLRNVRFHLATIDRVPLPDASVDCVISNCVINLAPDKPAVFREIARVLKPGGRLAVSDIALKQPLPPEIASDVSALVGCVAGAIPVDEYEAGLREAGFAAVVVADTGADLAAYAKVEGQAVCCAPANAPANATTPSNTSPDPLALAPDPASACCQPPAPNPGEPGVHERLRDILERHDINAYAASVKIHAVKA